MDAQIAGIQDEVARLGKQLILQERLVAAAAYDFDRAEEVAARGFVSQQDVRRRERLLIEAELQQKGLEAQRASHFAQLESLAALKRQRGAEAASDAAALRGEQAELSGRLTRLKAAEAYSVNAPASGLVTALSSHEGASVDSGKPLMLILPPKGRLIAELEVPQGAIGFVSVGQDVKLMIDAFPYQTFGTVDGRIIEVSSAPISVGRGPKAYVARALISKTSIRAFGQERPLLPGMDLNARIITRRQSLFAWLFEPLFAVSRR